jgi:hypothetical protein
MDPVALKVCKGTMRHEVYAVADVNGVLRSLINFKARYKAKSPNWMALLTAWAEVTQSSLW